MKIWKFWFLRTIGIIICCIAVFCGISEYMLYRINEQDVGTETAIKKQLEGNVLYGSALREDPSYLKFAIIEEKKPDILILGSSRVMQFRQKFFYNSMYTMGGLVISLNDITNIWEEVEKIYKPKIIIIGVDMWWFNPQYSMMNEEHFKKSNLLNEDENLKIFINNRIYMYRRFWNEIVFNNRFRNICINNNIDKNNKLGYQDKDTIGASALYKRAGYRIDGSYFYGYEFMNEIENPNHLKSIEKNKLSRLKRTDFIDKNNLIAFKNLIHRIKKENVEVVVFLPPFPEEVYDLLSNTNKSGILLKEFEYNIKNICKEEQVSFYNFGNMAWLDSSDNEALDGLHGSERTYAKLVLKMRNDKILGSYINEKYIKERLLESKDVHYIIPYNE